MNRSLLPLCAYLLLAISIRADVWPSFAGRLLVDSPVRFALEAKGALAPWRTMTTSGTTERPDGTREFGMEASNAPRIEGVFRVEGVEAEWTFTPESDVRMEMFGLMADLRISDYGGGTLVANGEIIPLPVSGVARNIRRENLSRLELTDHDGGRRLTFAFREPVDLFLQYWGSRTMSFRLILPPDDHKTLLYRGGVTRRLAFVLDGAGQCLKTTMTPVEVAAGPDWIPLDARGVVKSGSALDFSALRPSGKPCGAFGHVVAHGAHFEFEGMPGVPQRFYGANLCHEANFPETSEDARVLARTLARVGYNSVRIHHHDGFCIDRSDPARVRLDEAKMRRMDALVAACSEEGIYISTDLFVSRTRFGLPWRACGVDRDGDMTMEDFKRCVYVHEGVYSNFLAFARNWLCHTNAFTGRRYADEPALAWISLVNEANIDFSSSSARTSRPGWTETWEKWLSEKKAAEPGKYAGITTEIPNGLNQDRKGRAFLLFLQDVEARFIERTRAFLHSLGCTALLTDMNDGWGCTAALVKERADSCDYVDLHFYIDHPNFLETPWKRPSWCPNENPFKGEALGAAPVSALRVFNRPFTVSEYNFSGPGRFRGVGGIAAGAEAALQDWAGLWRFAWSHGLRGAVHPGTETAGYFDIAADPLQLASERASVCLFLRGDAEPLPDAYAISLPRERLSSLDAPIGMQGAMLDWVWAAWYARIGCEVAEGVGSPPAGQRSIGDFGEAFAKSSDDMRRDLGLAPGAEIGTDAVKIDPLRGTFRVATPRTCGVFAESGTLQAGPLTVRLGNGQSDNSSLITRHSSLRGGNPVPATVWVSSLDGKPIATSSHLLLSHLTDVQNTGARYADEAMTVLLDWGRLPYLMRAGKADIELRLGDAPGKRALPVGTDRRVARDDFDNLVNDANGINGANPAEWRVYALSPTGERRRTISFDFHATTSVLHFTVDIAADPQNATFLYEIVRP